MPRMLTREMVAEALEQVREVERLRDEAAAPSEADRALLEAAAVSAYFDPDVLRARVPTADRPESLPRLLAAAVVVRDEFGRPRWMLQDEVRREALKRLVRQGRLQKTLDVMRPRVGDALELTYDRCLRGAVPPLERQSLVELRACRRVADWLEGILPPAADPEELRRHIAFGVLLQPFHHLVGEHFRGREDELRQLRKYVDALPEKSLLGRARQQIESIIREHFDRLEAAPLMVWGPGGMGKSSLIARFVLNHVATARPVTFVYLDFDRPGLAPERVETLLAEAAAQLALQHRPSAARLADGRGKGRADIRKGWEDFRTAASERSVDPQPLSLEERRVFFDRFRTLLQSSGFADEPLLWVLDTFEEVQYRSRDLVNGVGGFIADLQGIVPRVRVVLAGRAPVNEFETQSLELKGFDRVAAVAYIMGQGVEDRELAQRVASRLGGTPLTLRLAAELLRADPRGSRSIRDWNVRSMGFLRAKDGEIQAQLYRRILDHIHDRDVRRLAHPGLILRRITAELIMHVLARPCRVHVPDMERAGELFHEMRREVSLVSLAPDGALEHRSDVRRVMGSLLAADDAKRVRQIHVRAIRYYRRLGGLQARAEEIYHRLALGQATSTIDARWNSAVLPFLANAHEELPDAARAYLASRSNVDAYVPEAVWQQVDLSVWERRTFRRARDLAHAGEPAKALAVLRERRERVAGSRLYVLEAEVLEALGRLNEALEVTGRGIEELSSANDRTGLIPLLIADGRLRAKIDDVDHASHVLRHGRQLAEDAGDRVAVLEAAYERALLRWRLSYGFPPDSTADLSDRFAEISDREVRENPVLVRRVAAEICDAAALRRVLALAGLPGLTSAQLDLLADALIGFDERSGTGAAALRAAWATVAGAPPFQMPHRTWRWSIRRAAPAQLTLFLEWILDTLRPDRPLLKTISGLMQPPQEVKAVSPRVLFVMDAAHEGLGQTYADALMAAGLDVLEAYELEDVLRRLREDRPDILLMDFGGEESGAKPAAALLLDEVDRATEDRPPKILLLTPPVRRPVFGRFQEKRATKYPHEHVPWETDAESLVYKVRKLLES